jgi:hypothetical protein
MLSSQGGLVGKRYAQSLGIERHEWIPPDGRGDRSGYSIASAGDVNGDGFCDLIIGAPLANTDDSSLVDMGASYVVFGKAGGWASTFDLSMLDGANGFRIEGAKNSDRSGVWVSSAGDVNGDGYDDLLIGARGAEPDGVSDAGAVYVVYGKAGGWAANIDLSTLDGEDGFRLDGVGNNSRSGVSVSAACRRPCSMSTTAIFSSE